MSGPNRRLPITLGQAVYLRDLVQDDMTNTKLTTSEYQQARAAFRKLDKMMREWWPESTFDPSSTGQSETGGYVRAVKRADRIATDTTGEA